jgi:hypothetical protein
MRRVLGRFGPLCLVVCAMALPSPAIAAGAIIVGGGTPASCTEAALQNALNLAVARHGGTIRFRCGRGPTTIVLTADLVIPDNTTIDGDGVISLHGVLASPITVEAGARVTVRGVRLTSDDSESASNAGTLTVVDSIFAGGFGICGGAIHNNGTLTVRTTHFANNTGFFDGGAVCNIGTATIHDSTFEDNEGGGGANGGGALWNVGEMTVTGSTFTHNTGFNDRAGAVYNGGVLTVRESVFFQNDGGAGGAIFNDALGFFTDPIAAGTLTVRNTVILENAANGVGSLHDGRGGGIANRGGVATIVNSVISGNTATAPGGGVYTCCGGTTTLKKTVVIGNAPDNVVVDP